MNNSKYQTLIFASCTTLLLGACSVAKIEARIEADPDCKPIVNAKTGALMPCPGSSKDFYRLNLKPTPNATLATDGVSTTASPSVVNGTPSATGATASAASVAPPVKVAPPVECKPPMHAKTGVIMPCPAP